MKTTEQKIRTILGDTQELYALGFKHGSQTMKNNVLKGVNRDIKCFYNTNIILEKISKMNLPKAPNPTQTQEVQDFIGGLLSDKT